MVIDNILPISMRIFIPPKIIERKYEKSNPKRIRIISLDTYIFFLYANHKNNIASIRIRLTP
jgi:hypothetical protein